LRARRLLLETVLASEPLFRVKPWFLADQFSALDAAIAPILWRLPHWQVVLPDGTAAIERYCRKVFAHPAFRASLSEREREMPH
jgi:RNA polymerase-associated protein